MRKLKKSKKVVKRFFTILGVLILVVILSFLYAYRPQSFDDVTNNMMDEVAYVVCSEPEHLDLELEALKNSSFRRYYDVLLGGSFRPTLYFYNSNDELLFKTTRIGNYSVNVVFENENRKTYKNYTILKP